MSEARQKKGDVTVSSPMVTRTVSPTGLRWFSLAVAFLLVGCGGKSSSPPEVDPLWKLAPTLPSFPVQSINEQESDAFWGTTTAPPALVDAVASALQLPKDQVGLGYVRDAGRRFSVNGGNVSLYARSWQVGALTSVSLVSYALIQGNHRIDWSELYVQAAADRAAGDPLLASILPDGTYDYLVMDEATKAVHVMSADDYAAKYLAGDGSVSGGAAYAVAAANTGCDVKVTECATSASLTTDLLKKEGCTEIGPTAGMLGAAVCTWSEVGIIAVRWCASAAQALGTYGCLLGTELVTDTVINSVCKSIVTCMPGSGCGNDCPFTGVCKSTVDDVCSSFASYNFCGLMALASTKTFGRFLKDVSADLASVGSQICGGAAEAFSKPLCDDAVDLLCGRTDGGADAGDAAVDAGRNADAGKDGPPNTDGSASDGPRDARVSADASGGRDGGGSGGTGGTGGSIGPSLPAPPLLASYMTGDPHLLTFDGLRYNCQPEGEETFVVSNSGDLEVQARTQPFATKNVAVMAAVAARIETDRVAFYLDGTMTLNGAATAFPSGRTALPGGGAVWNVGGLYALVWPDNSQVRLAAHDGVYFSVNVYLAAARAGQVSGLLGNANGLTGDDLTTRDGATVLTSPAAFTQFYGTYVESWRVSQASSLFDYAAGQTTETFTDRSFPRQIETVQSLTSSEVTSATTICQTAGVSSDWLDDCVLDVAESNGNADFAATFASAPPVTASFDIQPNFPNAGTASCVHTLLTGYIQRTDGFLYYYYNPTAPVLDDATGKALSGSVSVQDDATTGSGCAALDDGTVKCWLTSTTTPAVGQLGNGTTAAGSVTYRATPVVTKSGAPLTNVRSLPSGNYAGAACAVTNDGELSCWGDLTWIANNGVTLHSGSAQLVTIDGTTPLSGVEQVVLGDRQACVLRDGAASTEVWCWGYNGGMELGQGDTKNRQYPTKVAGLTAPTWLALAAAGSGAMDSTVCAFDSGHVLCWGSNAAGAAGVGSTSASIAVPTAVVDKGGTPLSGVVEIESGAQAFAVRRTDGTMWTWGGGANSYAAAYGVTGVVAIGYGGNANFAPLFLTSDGTLHHGTTAVSVTCSGP